MKRAFGAAYVRIQGAAAATKSVEPGFRPAYQGHFCLQFTNPSSSTFPSVPAELPALQQSH